MGGRMEHACAAFWAAAAFAHPRPWLHTSTHVHHACSPQPDARLTARGLCQCRPAPPPSAAPPARLPPALCTRAPPSPSVPWLPAPAAGLTRCPARGGSCGGVVGCGWCACKDQGVAGRAYYEAHASRVVQDWACMQPHANYCVHQHAASPCNAAAHLDAMQNVRAPVMQPTSSAVGSPSSPVMSCTRRQREDEQGGSSDSDGNGNNICTRATETTGSAPANSRVPSRAHHQLLTEALRKHRHALMQPRLQRDRRRRPRALRPAAAAARRVLRLQHRRERRRRAKGVQGHPRHRRVERPPYGGVAAPEAGRRTGRAAIAHAVVAAGVGRERGRVDRRHGGLRGGGGVGARLRGPGRPAGGP